MGFVVERASRYEYPIRTFLYWDCCWVIVIGLYDIFENEYQWNSYINVVFITPHFQICRITTYNYWCGIWRCYRCNYIWYDPIYSTYRYIHIESVNAIDIVRKIDSGIYYYILLKIIIYIIYIYRHCTLYHNAIYIYIRGTQM